MRLLCLLFPVVVLALPAQALALPILEPWTGSAQGGPATLLATGTITINSSRDRRSDAWRRFTAHGGFALEQPVCSRRGARHSRRGGSRLAQEAVDA